MILRVGAIGEFEDGLKIHKGFRNSELSSYTGFASVYFC
jgi:hypothetical protein